jgi:hypothetical protein
MLIIFYRQVPYSSPISVSSYPILSVGLIGVGFLFMALFFIFQMKSGNKNFPVEIVIAAISSGALGFGTLFAMLSFGLYI